MILHQEKLIVAIQRISLGKKYITADLAKKIVAAKSHGKAHELLSNREFEIFKLMALGKTITQIAEMLSLASSAVSTHRQQGYRKAQPFHQF